VYFKDHEVQHGHGRRSARSGAVSMFTRAVNTVFQFALALMLARLLTPEDYGLVAMVLAITGVVTMLVDLGCRDAIARRQTVAPAEVSALFWITTVNAAVLAVVVAGSGPLIARFYGEARLTTITLVSSLVLFTTALAAVPNALMRRALLFQRLAFIEVVAGMSSGILSVALAATGWGYWALVIRPLAMSAFIAAALWLHCRWLPVKPAVTSGVRDMLKFGVTLVGNSITEFCRNNLDRVAVGWRYGAASLGQYQNANAVYSNVIDPFGYLQEVAVGSLSRLLHDLPEFRRLWAKAIATLTFFVMPAFGLLAVIGADLVVLLLGRKWQAAGVILSVLAFRGIPQVLERTLGWLHVSVGRADRWVRWSLLATAVQLGAVAVGLPFGLTGVALGLVLSTYVLFLPALAYAGKPVGIDIPHTIRAAGKPFVGTIAAVIAAFAVRDALGLNDIGFQRAVIVGASFVTCYLAIVIGIFRMIDPLFLGWSLLRDLLPKRFEPAMGPTSLRQP
jgi:PST family polysaccharide transporter